MSSVVPLIAIALMNQLTARGFAAPSQSECEEIVRASFEEAVKAGEQAIATRRPTEVSP